MSLSNPVTRAAASVLTELDPVGHMCGVVTHGCGFWFCKSKGLGNGGLVLGFLSQFIFVLFFLKGTC